MGSAKNSQVMRAKCKEIVNISSENEARQWPSKKARGK